jgi:hypothetical protein
MAWLNKALQTEHACSYCQPSFCYAQSSVKKSGYSYNDAYFLRKLPNFQARCVHAQAAQPVQTTLSVYCAVIITIPNQRWLFLQINDYFTRDRKRHMKVTNGPKLYVCSITLEATRLEIEYQVSHQD